MDDIKIYTMQEVADILKVTRRTVYTYVYNHKLKANKIGKEWRVSHEDLQDFIKGNKS